MLEQDAASAHKAKKLTRVTLLNSPDKVGRSKPTPSLQIIKYGGLRRSKFEFDLSWTLVKVIVGRRRISMCRNCIESQRNCCIFCRRQPDHFKNRLLFVVPIRNLLHKVWYETKSSRLSSRWGLLYKPFSSSSELLCICNDRTVSEELLRSWSSSKCGNWIEGPLSFDGSSPAAGVYQRYDQTHTFIFHLFSEDITPFFSFCPKFGKKRWSLFC